MLPRTVTRLIRPVNPARGTAFSAALLHSTSLSAAPPRASSSSSSGPSNPNANATSNRRTSRPPPGWSSAVQRQPRNQLDNTKVLSKKGFGPHFRQNGQPYDDSYLLCDQLKLLSSRDQLDKAIDLVRRTSAPVCTVVVWNVLINEVLHLHGDANKAYELWMEMKRRGFVPTTRSFATVLRGFASIAIKAKRSTGTINTTKAITSSTALSRARTIHSQWVTHVGNALGLDKMTLQPDSDQLSVLPTNHFLTFLGSTDQWDLVLETFNSLPASGPLAPNSATYSLVLGFLKALPPSPQHFKLAIDIFNRMLDTLPQSQMDNRTLSIILSICRDQVRPDDQALGISIATQVFGLLPPSETHRLDDPATPKPLRQMDQASLSSVLTLLLKMQRYNLAVEWFDQVRDHPERFGTDVVAKEQCELVLQAWVAKRGDAGAEALLEWTLAQGIEPTTQCYALAIKACWKNVNLSRAYHILSRMTGQRLPLEKKTAATAASGSSSSPSIDPPLVPFSPKRIYPSRQALTYLLHTALSTRDRAQLSEALSTFLASRSKGGLQGLSYLFDPEPETKVEGNKDSKARTKPMEVAERYFRFTLHRVLERCLAKVLDVPREVMGRYLTAGKVEEWKGVLEETREWIGRNRYANLEDEEGGEEREDSMERRYKALKQQRKERRGRERTQAWEGRGKQTLDAKRRAGEGKRERRRMGFERF